MSKTNLSPDHLGLLNAILTTTIGLPFRCGHKYGFGPPKRLCSFGSPIYRFGFPLVFMIGVRPSYGMYILLCASLGVTGKK